MAPSTIVPKLQFQRPFEAEARCTFTGKKQSFRPVNEQAVSNAHLPRLPFTGKRRSFCPRNEQATTHGHRPQLPFTGQNQSSCLVNEQAAAIHDHLPQLPYEESQANSDDSVNRAIKKALLAYIQYKKTVRNHAPGSFVSHMHSTVCCFKTCKCLQFSSLASHYDGCHDAKCKICGPVRRSPCTDRFLPNLEHVKGGLQRVSGKGDSGQPRFRSSEAMQPLPKRLKLENPTSPCLPYNGMFLEDSTIAKGKGMAPSKIQPSFTNLPPLVQLPDFPVSSNSEVMEANIELLPKLLKDSTVAKGMGKNIEVEIESLPKLIEDSTSAKETATTMEVDTELLTKLTGDSSSAEEIGKDVADSFPGIPEAVIASYKVAETNAVGSHKEEDIEFINGTDNARDHFNKLESNREKLETKTELIAQELNCGKEIKLESQKQGGVSLIETFTAQQIKEHISSLRECIDQDRGKKEGGEGIVDVDSKDSCQLCGAAKLSLAPAPIYCSSCCARIRRSAAYYSIPEVNGIGDCLCSSCYNASRSHGITTSGKSVSKAKLIKMKNNDEPEESWVQCDKCKCWQHQICALFNEKRNKKEKDYICPKCYLEEIENGERMPPPGRTVFGAKDLPRTRLSDHLEQRLFRCLQKNRKEKARASGISIDEVPKAEGLVVREVLSVQKLVKVNKQLLDVLQHENYPSEFPYKSKVILLFQNIEGADVCLFIMYVQEFGAECGQPNQRCVYISYLDSVKYFRPETETAANGEALRTGVYHEILVGYLEYCKKRGFTTCYIWACPPTKGDDYILYCHPEVQKIPKPDKLRQWHKTMLQKAAKAGIVVDFTNLYNQFFSTGKYNTKVTAAHLPYFDGDYWSGASEDRTLQAMGHTNPSGHAIKDILLMQKLGQNILPMKEDFIVAHLQFVCECCHRAILNGCRWSCRLCKSFQLCGRCHDAKRSTYKDSTHTLWNGEKHSLHRIMVDGSDTDDKDADMDNGLFENRYNFLLFCQKNNYQFDTLRRAKHSSMMILYYLHNPAALLATTTTTTCCICNKDTPTDQCWHCETCSDFSVCATCYQRDGCSSHIHKSTPHSSAVDSSTENRETSMMKKLSKVLEVLLHSARCRSRCSDPHCHLMKKLFSHSKACTVRSSGGCRHCKKAWLILIMHARNCKESDCVVPRCRDLKQHAKSLAQKPAAV
ncbi:hypothetical protein HRI_003804800 [Hibiscus trionum]|uniref:histone acetyltransferase n=1 Tax=Hibiscus trionum TaxID=183268 RepID=A0A9W7IS85_HIBTR|nr:hypothetical protein HRI_003804800 [Hibiscus trionum]